MNGIKYNVDNYIGKSFGDLIILSVSTQTNKGGNKFVLARCKCGKEKNIPLSNIVRGHSKSCGCKILINLKNSNVTHNLSNHLLYFLWRHIKSRCLNNNSKHFYNYGGRGICICAEWINNFEIFYQWAITNGWMKGLQIDRINNDGNYEPSNCRFVTSKVNCRNKRNNTFLYFKGENKTISEWSDILGIKKSTISSRINRGNMPTELALKK